MQTTRYLRARHSLPVESPDILHNGHRYRHVPFLPERRPAATGRIKTDWQLGNIQAAAPMPITSPGNDDDTGENHQPTLRKNTAEPVEQTLKQNTTSTGRACSTGSSRAATRGGASRPPRTSGPANGARSSRTTSSRPRSSTGSCIMDACSSSPGRATASARRSCSEGRPPDPRPNPRRRQRNRPERSLAKIEIFS